MRHAATALATAGTLAMTLLSGCAGDKNNDESLRTDEGTVVIKEVDGRWLENSEDGVAYIEKDGEITGLELVLGGSGTEECAPQIRHARVSDTELVVTLADPPEGQACTMDLRPYTWDIGVHDPSGITSVTIDGGEHRESRVFKADDFVSGADSEEGGAQS